MKKFIDFILQFGNLNQQQIELISNKANELELRREEYFVEAGKVFRHIGFIVEGIIRICYYNNKGEEITKIFLEENHLLFSKKMFPLPNIYRQLPIANLLYLQYGIGKISPIPLSAGSLQK